MSKKIIEIVYDEDKLEQCVVADILNYMAVLNIESVRICDSVPEFDGKPLLNKFEKAVTDAFDELVSEWHGSISDLIEEFENRWAMDLDDWLHDSLSSVARTEEE